MVQSWRALHASLPKIALSQRISLSVQNRDIEKCILMAASEDTFILEIFLSGCFSKTAANYIYLRNSRLHIFYISYFDVMLKRNEYSWILFLSNGFDEKCKLKELDLNFIQKQYFS